jgi:hypothetical protein
MNQAKGQTRIKMENAKEARTNTNKYGKRKGGKNKQE